MWRLAAAFGVAFCVGCTPCVPPGKYDFFAVVAAGQSSTAGCPSSISGTITWQGAETTFDIEGFRGSCEVTDDFPSGSDACEMKMRCHGFKGGTDDDATLTTFSFVKPGKPLITGSGGLVGQPMISAQWIQPSSDCVGAYTWTARRAP